MERGASGGVAGDEQERTGTMSAHVEVLKTWASFTAYAENLDVGSTFQSAYYYRGESRADWRGLRPSLLRRLLRWGEIAPEAAIHVERVALAEFQARALRDLPTCRKEIYEALCRVASTDEGVLPFIDCYLDRTEGRSGRKVQQPAAHWSTFILTTRDAQQAEMNSTRTPTPAAVAPVVAGDDALILRLERASSWPRRSLSDHPIPSPPRWRRCAISASVRCSAR